MLSGNIVAVSSKAEQINDFLVTVPVLVELKPDPGPSGGVR